MPVQLTFPSGFHRLLILENFEFINCQLFFLIFWGSFFNSIILADSLFNFVLLKLLLGVGINNLLENLLASLIAKQKIIFNHESAEKS